MKAIGEYDSSLRLEETLLPSFNSVDLKRTVQSDYYNRFMAKQPHVAELFHVNSKLSRYSTMEIAADRRPFDDARQWFYETSYKLREDDFHADLAHLVRTLHGDLPQPLQDVVKALAEPEQQGALLSGLDVFLMFDRKLFRVVPARDFVWLERKITDKLADTFCNAFLPEQRELADLSKTYLFVAGCFWRYQMFYGPRGYRMALMDAGRLMSFIERSLPVTTIEHFYDGEMDEVILLDGVERSVLNVLRLEE